MKDNNKYIKNPLIYKDSFLKRVTWVTFQKLINMALAFISKKGYKAITGELYKGIGKPVLKAIEGYTALIAAKIYLQLWQFILFVVFIP